MLMLMLSFRPLPIPIVKETCQVWEGANTNNVYFDEITSFFWDKKTPLMNLLMLECAFAAIKRSWAKKR